MIVTFWFALIFTSTQAFIYTVSIPPAWTAFMVGCAAQPRVTRVAVYPAADVAAGALETVAISGLNM